MNTTATASDAKSRMKALTLVLLTLSLVFSLFTLAGCGGSKAEEQDNCYGDDMPVINEE